MLNWAILKNPFNWLIVMFMLIIAGFIVDILGQYHVSKNVNVSGAHAS